MRLVFRPLLTVSEVIRTEIIRVFALPHKSFRQLDEEVPFVRRADKGRGGEMSLLRAFVQTVEHRIAARALRVMTTLTRELVMKTCPTSAAVLCGIVWSLQLGCIHAEPDVRPISRTQERVQGLRDLASKETQPIRILTIHGMGAQDSNYSAQWQQSLVERLGPYKALRKSETVPLKRKRPFILRDGPDAYSLDDFPQLESRLRVTRWVKSQVDRNTAGQATSDTLIFYELLWAPYRDVIKRGLLSCFERLGETRRATDSIKGPARCPKWVASFQRNSDRRAFLNAYIKDGTMIGGLPDASIVISRAADVLRSDVDEAMCLIGVDVLGGPLSKASPCSDKNESVTVLSQTTSNKDKLEKLKSTFVVLTHSLGGFLIVDGQRRLVTDSTYWIAKKGYEALNSSTVFMMANQLSLLELGRLETRDSAGILRDTTRTTLVAFNDRNDLLDFELQPSLGALHSSGTVVNVSVRNRCWVAVKVLKDPSCAHGGYYRTPSVTKAIVDGIDLRADRIPNPLMLFTARVGSTAKRFGQWYPFVEVASHFRTVPDWCVGDLIPLCVGYVIPDQIGLRWDIPDAVRGSAANTASLTMSWFNGLLTLRQQIGHRPDQATPLVPKTPVLGVNVLSFIEPGEGLRGWPAQLRLEWVEGKEKWVVLWQLR